MVLLEILQVDKQNRSENLEADRLTNGNVYMKEMAIQNCEGQNKCARKFVIHIDKIKLDYASHQAQK